MFYLTVIINSILGQNAAKRRVDEKICYIYALQSYVIFKNIINKLVLVNSIYKKSNYHFIKWKIQYDEKRKNK